jgi:protein involved in ribonucleotide reduction
MVTFSNNVKRTITRLSLSKSEIEEEEVEDE